MQVKFSHYPTNVNEAATTAQQLSVLTSLSIDRVTQNYFLSSHTIWSQFHQRISANHKFVGAQSLMQLNLHAQIEVTPNFYTERSVPYTSTFSINLLVQNLLAK